MILTKHHDFIWFLITTLDLQGKELTVPLSYSLGKSLQEKL